MVNNDVDPNGINNNSLAMQRLSVACGVMFSLSMYGSKASASSFDLNQDWKLESNTSLSLGQSWSMSEPDTALVYRPDAHSIGKPGNSVDVNGDDGHANFSQHDSISQIIKGYTEFKLNGPDQGAVLSAKYWYDHAYETGHGDLKPFDDSEWPRLAKFKGIDLWDAYLWKNFKFENGQALNVKLGKHSLNWGKSLFLQNGLNSVSAFDYAAMNRPGGDVRERVIPVEMFSFAAELKEGLKLEGFYQFKFRPSVVDGCGTFFAISDFVPEHCGPVILTVTPGNKLTDTALENKSYIPRDVSRKAKDSGQFGFALKQTLPSLNNAELGVYYANYHGRTPNFDGYTVTAPGPKNFNTASYFSVYPEDIDMYGLSLTGKIGSTNIFTELNYKPSQPLQLNGTDIVYYQVLSNESPLSPPGVTPGMGEYVDGHVRLPVTQFSIGASDSISNLFGANVFNWAAEFGVNHIADIGNHRIGRAGAFGRSELSTGAYNPETKEFQCTPYGTAHLSNDEIDRMNEAYCNREGFFSQWSLGYRLRGALSYKDLLPGTVISPSLSFRHDLHGYSQNFQEGQMSIGAAVSATIDKKYSAELAYFNFFGSNDFSVMDDRDFASLAFKVNF
ncbi:uncharacterized protein DUF1302 [Acinetobacter calcoaceticus]|uniref:Uncharacterized protein DUF1302 n=1 Tax=Acinetobacter calcoaceticus TaxID=471 RepID=A0A4R1XZ09_ACICA|nr:uncharacterized protein DUF1302 [Acinetobacter calcoaceticus]